MFDRLMKAGARKSLVLVLALAVLAALPAAATAQFAFPIRAVFLKEFSKPNYSMNQGEILAFENDDPFLSQGVFGPGFSSPVTVPGGSRLVRGAPYLRPGTYTFHDPLYPEVTSTLTVTSAGAPLPPDSAKPTSRLKIVSHSAKGGNVKVRVAPSEPADVSLSAFAGKKLLGTGPPRAFVLAGGRAAMTVALTAPGARALLAQSAGRLEIRATITDAAGNDTKLRKSRQLK